MQNERKNKLLATMKKINKDMKSEIMDFADNSEDAEVLYSGIEQFDNFFGGFKKGNFSVIWGGMSVGKTTLMYQTIANIQTENKIVCFIDMERSFNKVRAVELGVDLKELILVSDCQTAEQALEIVRTLCKEKVVDCIMLDSLQSMSPLGEQQNKGKERGLAEREMAELARTLSKFFRVVAPDVYRAKVACILIGQIRMSLGSFIVRADLSGGEALKHFAYINCFVRRGQKSDAPVKKFKKYFLDEGSLRYETISESIGFDSVMQLKKTKSSTSAKEGSEIHLPFLYDKGFVTEFNPDDAPEVLIDPEATNEDKIKINLMLKEKGIIPYGKDSIILSGEPPKNDKIISMVEDEINTIGEVKDVSKSIQKIEKLKKENPVIEKKKRGRPKGKKK